jgi:hypothetical protein
VATRDGSPVRRLLLGTRHPVRARLTWRRQDLQVDTRMEQLMAVEAGTSEPELNGMQLSRFLGVSYRRVDYWARNGWLIPTEHVMNGGRGERLFRGDNLEHAIHMIRLVIEFEMSPKVASAVATDLLSNEERVSQRGGYSLREYETEN